MSLHCLHVAVYTECNSLKASKTYAKLTPRVQACKFDHKEFIMVNVVAFFKFCYLFHTTKLDSERCTKLGRFLISISGVPFRLIADEGHSFAMTFVPGQTIVEFSEIYANCD